MIHDVGTRAIKLFPHQIDTILIQFQQLGYVTYVENEGTADRDAFRGYTLTEAGETYLTQLKLTVRE